MSLAGIFNSHLIMAACVERVGTEEQKRKYLPRFATGELRGGLALTEPDCGTDLQADPHARGARGQRCLPRQRHQDLDLQRHPRPGVRAAGEDRSRGPAAPQGHEHAAGREGAGLPRLAQAREDRLQGHRLGRADLRGLPRAGLRADRRRRGPRPADGAGRARARAHQRGRARLRPRQGGARRVRALRPAAQAPSASRSPSTRRSSSSSPRWRSAPRPPSR